MGRQRFSRVDQQPFLPPFLTTVLTADSTPTERRQERRYNGSRRCQEWRWDGGRTATRPRELHFENLISYVRMYRTYGLIQDLAGIVVDVDGCVKD